MADDAPIDLGNAGIGFALVAAAGLSTAAGAAAVFERRIVKLASKPILGAGLGFSGGVMLYVSFIEIFGKSQGAFEADGYEERDAYFSATACLFGGMLLLRVIDFLVHRIDSSHSVCCDAECVDAARDTSVEVPPLMPVAGDSPSEGSAAPTTAASPASQEAAGHGKKQPAPAVAPADIRVFVDGGESDRRLQQMGLNTALAIGVHNFPEGLATFVATLADPTVGATLAVAIGVHNIPEGLCVALPIYYATGSRLKGFLWALLSGISEPIGALIGWLIIKASGEDMSQVVYGVLFGIVAGMMIMIVILELLPTAYKYDTEDRFVTHSATLGMATMAASLCLFKV